MTLEAVGQRGVVREGGHCRGCRRVEVHFLRDDPADGSKVEVSEWIDTSMDTLQRIGNQSKSVRRGVVPILGGHKDGTDPSSCIEAFPRYNPGSELITSIAERKAARGSDPNVSKSMHCNPKPR